MNTYKLEVIKKRQQERDERSVSVLDSLGVDLPKIGTLAEVTKPTVTLEDKPVPCSNCEGTGKVKGLFGSFDCYSCEGTKFDLSDPVAIIKWQALCNEWAKIELMKARKERDKLEEDLRLSRMTKEELEQEEATKLAKSVDKFYSGNDRKPRRLD